MTIKLRAKHSEALPRLGWLAVIDFRAQVVTVICGNSVEIGDEFVVEGVWDGPFQEGGFHRAHHFFGSGLRVDGEQVFVVPSHGLVDRVVLAKRGAVTFASNSLLLLLAATGDALDPEHDYRGCCKAIIAGVRAYDPNIPVAGSGKGGVWQGFHTPQVLDRSGLKREDMSPPRKFNSFDEYHYALQSALGAIMDNAGAATRDNPIASYTTTSTGYDSTAVSALAKEFGVTHSYTTFGGPTFDGKTLEDGRPVTSALGIKALELKPRKPDRWHEQLVLAATYDGRETLYANMFERFAAQQHVACLWSGYHGDTIWDRTTSGKYLEPDIRRGDMSGFNLSEVRLDVGFINLSIPFMFSSSIRHLVHISNLPEMANWQVGGDYDRPIPRRIAEHRGVPRELFGQKKSLIMEYYTYCRNPDLAKEFMQYLTSHQDFGLMARMWYRAAEQLDYWRKKISVLSVMFPQQWSARDALRPGASNLANTLYVWAVNNAKETYARNCADELQGVLEVVDRNYKPSLPQRDALKRAD
jgi:hypothetical protein